MAASKRSKSGVKKAVRPKARERNDVGVKALQRVLGRPETGQFDEGDAAALTVRVNALSVNRKELAQKLGFKHWFDGAEHPDKYYAKGRPPISQQQAKLLGRYLSRHVPEPVAETEPEPVAEEPIAEAITEMPGLEETTEEAGLAGEAESPGME